MDYQLIIASIVNFVIVLYVLWHYGREPFAKFLIQRSKALDDMINENQRHVDEAKKTLAHWEVCHQQAEEHVKKLLEEARSSFARLREKTLASAQAESVRIKKEAQLMGTGEVLRAKQQLQQELVGKSVDLATQYLGKQLDAPARHKLVTEYMELMNGAR